VEAYVDSLLEKMNARSKTEAAVRAIREGIFGRA
jgi:DNA-binding NarL/FixJ family response regulator